MNVIIDGVEYEPIRKPLCEVEGKPVYKGDKLFAYGCEMAVIAVVRGKDVCPDIVHTSNGTYYVHDLTWNQQKRTVMIEITVDDAEALTNFDITYRDVAESCRKALDNLK